MIFISVLYDTQFKKNRKKKGIYLECRRQIVCEVLSEMICGDNSESGDGKGMDWGVEG